MIENRPDELRKYISPFVPEKMRDGPAIIANGKSVVPSYGMAESGYDIRCGQRVVLVPGMTMLTVSLETITMPYHLTARLICKSTLARLGIHLNVTEIDPGYHGCPTLEVGLFPVWGIDRVEIPVGAGIGCLQFHEIRECREYVGKYQGDTMPVGAR